MTYYVPTGGLPGQEQLTTDRAVFTDAYAVLPRGTMRDIVTSQLPHWEQTRLWVIARPLTGFAETFSHYIVEVQPGGGSDEPDDFKDFETNRLTSDHVRWSRTKAVMETAPELAVGSPTVGWLRAALRSTAMLLRPDYPKYVCVPMMLFAAGADRVVSTQAIEDFAVDLKFGAQILMPGSRHEILQETDVVRQRFWAAFDAYMGITAASSEKA